MSMSNRKLEDFFMKNKKFASKLANQILNFLDEEYKSTKEIAKGIHRKLEMVKMSSMLLMLEGRIRCDGKESFFKPEDHNAMIKRIWKEDGVI